ncbi:hypothetical protein ACFL2C_02505 [Patescibacteria group bacterium]
MTGIKKFYYRLLNKIYPYPKMKKGESTELWLKRIDLKYAVRYVNQMKLYWFDYDFDQSEKSIKQYERAKDRKLLREFVQGVEKINNMNEEWYEMVMRRKYVEEEMERTT